MIIASKEREPRVISPPEDRAAYRPLSSRGEPHARRPQAFLPGAFGGAGAKPLRRIVPSPRKNNPRPAGRLPSGRQPCVQPPVFWPRARPRTSGGASGADPLPGNAGPPATVARGIEAVARGKSVTATGKNAPARQRETSFTQRETSFTQREISSTRGAIASRQEPARGRARPHPQRRAKRLPPRPP
jgi:hypothetical protein